MRMIFIWPWFLVLVLLSKSNFCQSELWQVEQKGSLLVYLKFLPLKFLIACFYRTFSRLWCLLKKTVPMNFENLLFEVSLFRFISFLHFSIYNVIIMNIQWSKQPPYTWSCLWNLHFFKCVFVIFRKWSNKLIYFWVTWQNSSMKGVGLGIFSKVPDGKPLFLLKIKIKQNPGCTNKGILKHIHQNIRVYPKIKKSALINDYENIAAHSEQSKQSEGVFEQVKFFLNSFLGSEGWCHRRKMWLFLPSFNSLETVFPACKLMQNCYKNIFFLKTGNLILVNWEQFGNTT